MWSGMSGGRPGRGRHGIPTIRSGRPTSDRREAASRGRIFGDSGAAPNSAEPVDVVGLTSGVTAIAAGIVHAEYGSHTCALTSVGGIKCWGPNLYGQLGNGSYTKSSTPVEVSGLASGVTAITVSNEHTCALTSGGGVVCWGSNSRGQLGNPVKDSSNVPVVVAGL
jgi:alpha-tubulin suppressor-like RCC1 family protein